MSDLRDLYQEVILDHNKRPRNFRALPDAEPPAPRATTRSAATAMTVYRASSTDDVHQGRRLPGRGLRDLDGLRLDDDRER